MRRAELLNLELGDLRDNGIYIVSRVGRRTKSGKWRLIPYTNGARKAIKVLAEETKGEYLIPQKHKDSLSRAFKVCAERAGLPGSLHCLRHTYASHLVMAGVPLRAIQQVMGHSTITVTEKYAHLDPDYLDSRIGELVI